MRVEIANPGFGPPYRRQDGDKHLHVAEGWRAWWSTEKAESHDGDHHRPEYYEPEEGQGWQTTYATHRAGVFQQVDLPREAQALNATIQARYYAEDDRGRRGDLALRLGVDPAGGTDGSSEAIVWGEWRGQTDGSGWEGKAWQPLYAELERVPGQRVTLFVESRCRWPVRNNHAFVKGAELRIVPLDDGEPTPDEPSDLARFLREIRDLVARILARLEGQ